MYEEKYRTGCVRSYEEKAKKRCYCCLELFNGKVSSDMELFSQVHSDRIIGNRHKL